MYRYFYFVGHSTIIDIGIVSFSLLLPLLVSELHLTGSEIDFSIRALKNPKNCMFVGFLVRAPSVRLLETVHFVPQVLMEVEVDVASSKSWTWECVS